MFFRLFRIFGVVKHDNSVLKFRLIVKLERLSFDQNDSLDSFDMTLNLMYMNEEPIDCRVRIEDCLSEGRFRCSFREFERFERDMSISYLRKKFTNSIYCRS